MIKRGTPPPYVLISEFTFHHKHFDLAIEELVSLLASLGHMYHSHIFLDVRIWLLISLGLFSMRSFIKGFYINCFFFCQISFIFQKLNPRHSFKRLKAHQGAK